MTDNTKVDKVCDGCGGTLRFDGYSPSGKEEWYHVESVEELEENFN